jgi:4-amino-4-deoxy-L-arabinose transferase-like glycosyltransferase
MTEAIMARKSRLFVLALVLITALGAGLRFYHIDRLPPGLHYDEAFNNLLALRLPHWDPFPVFFFEVEFGRSVLHPYLIALLFRATGPIVLGGRLVSALAGSLTVPLLFFTVREMFRKSTDKRGAAALGIAAALSLAILYWHVHQSRVGMEPILVPALAVPAFGAVWRALHCQRFWDAAIAGVILGLTAYTYPTAILVPLLLALFFGLWAVFERGFLRANWRVLVIVTCFALLMVAPLGSFFATHPGWLTLRSSQVIRDNPLVGTWKVVKGLFTEGDQNPRQNLPGRPILDPIQGTLFILGVGTCLLRRRPPHLFVILWLVMMLLPSTLTEFPPNYRRMAGAAPAIATLVGLGAVTAYDLITSAMRRFSQASRRSSIGVLLFLVLAFTLSGVCTAREYFFVWGRSDDLFIAFDVGLRWIGEYVAALPLEARVYVSPTDRFWKTLEFLFEGDPFRTQNYNGRRCVVYPAVTETPTTHIIIVVEDPNSLPFLQAAFPDGAVVEELYTGDTLYLVAYRTPAGRTAQIGPIHTLQANLGGKVKLLGYDLPKETFSPGDTISLRLYWQARSPMTEWYKVFVHLWGTPNAPGGERSWGQQDACPVTTVSLRHGGRWARSSPTNTEYLSTPTPHRGSINCWRGSIGRVDPVSSFWTRRAIPSPTTWW